MINMIILVFLFASVTTSNVNYYHILPSADDSCPQDPWHCQCLTLSQFTDNSSLYDGYNRNITLLFHPGNHSLAVEFSVAAARNISMIAANVHGNDTAFVNCFNRSGRFRIQNSTFVWIKGLYFVGCGGNEIIQVEHFVLEDATFHGVSFGRWRRSLVLRRVANSIIIKSSFLLNSNIFCYGCDEAMYVSDSSFSIDNSHFTGNSASYKGGVVYALNSMFNISTSHFADNSALKGGVIYSSASVFNITDSTFINNSASKGGVLCTESSVSGVSQSFNLVMGTGGVMYAYYSSFSIGFSIFIGNRAKDVGGVLNVESDSWFDIFASNFAHNSASHKGGVMHTHYSSFSFVNNTVESNIVDSAGGVMYILQSSFTCNILASTFIKNGAYYSGGVIFSYGSRISIVSSIFVENSAENDGGVLLTYDSSFTNVSGSKFTHNRAGYRGGVILIWQSSLIIFNSSFMENNASYYGGAILLFEASTFNITATDFMENRASISGGTLYMHLSLSGSITSSKFIKNNAAYGTALFLCDNSSLHILTSTFDNNGNSSMFDNKSNSEFENNSTTKVTCTGKLIAKILGGTITECSIHRGVIALSGSLLSITSSNFTNNHATLGVVTAFKSNFSIANSTYANNRAKIGGVMSTFNASFSVSNTSFSKNLARLGGVACTFESSFSIFSSNFTDNEAFFYGGAIYTISTLQDFNVTIADSTFSKNNASYGGIMYISGTTADMINGTFYQNSRSFYAFSSNITFRGTTRFENCTEPLQKHNSEVSRKEGGAITSYHSKVTFTGETILLKNQAGDGGAIVAIDSDITMMDETLISSNIATSGGGGGMYLIQCKFYIHGRCDFVQNQAASLRGGGIYASGTSIVVQQRGKLWFTSNSAKNGGGVYLERSSRLVTVSRFPGMWSTVNENGLVKFANNSAENGSGGAIYIADTHSMSCFIAIECFIQSVASNKLLSTETSNFPNKLIKFSGNTATDYVGYNIYGGLFDRCTPSPFATVYTDDITSQYYYSGIDYLQTISSIIALDSIASDPVRVCFCNSTGRPDCSYETSTIKVKKGERFSVTIAAVDQVNRSVNATIRSLLISNTHDTHGRMGEGQQLQTINRNCTKLNYSIYSPDDSETILLFADGPCMASVLSRRNMSIQFLDCTCSIGFEPYPSDSECRYICSSALPPYITKCDPATNSVFRANTTSWITYINNTDPPGFMIYLICPLDYCYPPSENISINFNQPSGSDAQCAHNRSGILCGACQPNLSLSLGSSCCLSCPNHWPLAFIFITFAALIAGILIVTVILVLNMTVADGMINAIIFYTDVTAPFHRIVHSSASPNFPTVFIAWLNLDIGFDVCFFKGLDAYDKTWIHLLFPAYIIFLVVIVIKISKHSPRFTRLISSRRRDPVATLATLILLSYAKLLSTTISVLSYATLTYPDGSKSVVWLVDGSVQYLRGKHIGLVIAVTIIILFGVPYTFLLLFWQWLIRIPKINLNRWTRLNSIITPYHAPYNNRHRYWSGLLLLVRVVLYITVAVTVSSNPQIPLKCRLCRASLGA